VLSGGAESPCNGRRGSVQEEIGLKAQLLTFSEPLNPPVGKAG
jgi:hypothetical protein